ncbi:ribonuclease H-like domain-containing protein [Mycena floridula]|nr:ribonuclease H-like domain-containing protein [Mycena floridula]
MPALQYRTKYSENREKGTGICHRNGWPLSHWSITLVARTDALQFQLILGDYFKVYVYAAYIAEQATMLIGWINNHGKVRTIFDAAQTTVSRDRYGYVKVLSYLVANLTRWTTHYVAFHRLLLLRDALQLAVLRDRNAIIVAQVGATTYAEKERLSLEANTCCDLIKDTKNKFWIGLEQVLGDIEPVCYGTNINQKDSTRADQVLLTLVGLFLHFSAHPETEVSEEMVKRLEKRWKDCDQILFLLCLILNPFEGLSCFGPNANMDFFECSDLLLSLYRHMMDNPANTDTDDERIEKECQVTNALMLYLQGTGPFARWRDRKDRFEETMGKDPIAAWHAFGGTDSVKELTDFAILIFGIVVNQAGCERVFSHLKVQQTDHRAHLGLDKMEKSTRMQKMRLNVGISLFPQLLGWRTEMAKWIGDARAAEEESDDDLDDEIDEVPTIIQGRHRRHRGPKWRPMTLLKLFGGQLKLASRIVAEDLVVEAELMDALAYEAHDEEEDAIPDDGGLEGSGDDYC